MIEVPLQSFKDILPSMIFAVSKSKNINKLLALKGMYLQVDNKNGLRAVATDGHRLVKYKDKSIKGVVDPVIIPKKFLEIINEYSTNIESLPLKFGDLFCKAIIDKDEITTRFINERFPDYQSVIPTNNEKEILVDRNYFLESVKIISKSSNRETHLIALDVTGGFIIISTEDPERGIKARERIECDYDGNPIEIGFNVEYLIDIITAIKSNKVLIKLNTSLSAGLFYPYPQPSDNIEIEMLLMPIRLYD